MEFESETTSVKQSSGEKTIQDPTLAEGTKILEQSGHTDIQQDFGRSLK